MQQLLMLKFSVHKNCTSSLQPTHGELSSPTAITLLYFQQQVHYNTN